jgi:hypothetical protein
MHGVIVHMIGETSLFINGLFKKNLHMQTLWLSGCCIRAEVLLLSAQEMIWVIEYVL